MRTNKTTRTGTMIIVRSNGMMTMLIVRTQQSHKNPEKIALSGFSQCQRNCASRTMKHMTGDLSVALFKLSKRIYYLVKKLSVSVWVRVRAFIIKMMVRILILLVSMQYLLESPSRSSC